MSESDDDETVKTNKKDYSNLIFFKTKAGQEL